MQGGTCGSCLVPRSRATHRQRQRLFPARGPRGQEPRAAGGSWGKGERNEEGVPAMRRCALVAVALAACAGTAHGQACSIQSVFVRRLRPSYRSRAAAPTARPADARAASGVCVCVCAPAPDSFERCARCSCRVVTPHGDHRLIGGGPLLLHARQLQRRLSGRARRLPGRLRRRVRALLG